MSTKTHQSLPINTPSEDKEIYDDIVSITPGGTIFVTTRKADSKMRRQTFLDLFEQNLYTLH
jgi:hypothetical protein